MDERKVRTNRRAQEYAAASRQARAQADAYRERAMAHDRRMGSVMEMLNSGWQGSGATVVLRNLEDVHQSVRSRYLTQASKFDAQSDQLQRESFKEEDDPERCEGEEKWD